MTTSIIGVLVVAAAATAGDFIWYTYGVGHTMVAGLIHGAVLLTTVGAVLGAASGNVVRGLPIGTLSGIGGALSYYALVAIVDRRTYGAAIPLAWIIMWLLLAVFEGRWLRAPSRRTWAAIAGRGLAAAIIAGLAFYLVMNTLWGRPPEGGRNYAVQFVAWAFAWAPGLLILGLGGTRGAVSSDGTRAIGSDELGARIAGGERPRILDVRSEAEFAAGHVPGAVNIPFNKVPFLGDAVPGTADDELIVYCGHGPRAYIAAAALRHAGRGRIAYLDGHWAAWQRAGLPVER
jgi:rhodanese-related sulfurtransferase